MYGTRECAAQALVFRHRAEERRDVEVDRKKALRQDRRQDLARYPLNKRRISVRRACQCVEHARSAYYTELVI